MARSLDVTSLMRCCARLRKRTSQCCERRWIGSPTLTFYLSKAHRREANYRFKHALIQDAAYDSLLKSRRQALHRRAAEILRDDPDRAAAEPEVIAHHFTRGRS